MTYCPRVDLRHSLGNNCAMTSSSRPWRRGGESGDEGGDGGSGNGESGDGDACDNNVGGDGG